VIEGEEKLLIEDNQIIGNNDGIVLVDSEGFVRENVIRANLRSGILTANATTTIIDSNLIEEN
jgi:parallel beta-helix repeat protein